MFIKKTSGEFINSFIPTFKKNKKSSPKSKEYNNILKILYNDIYTAYINPRKTSCKKSNLNKITIKEVSKKPEMYNSNTRFFPLEIKKYINENEKYQLIYNCKVGGRDIRIYFTLFKEDDLLELDKYTEYVNMMYMWLEICASYSMKHCANTLDIYIYQTPFSKTLPNLVSTTIGADNVNTAFTTWCSPKSEIVIYRDEEWFKVFIHETFHTYGLDFGINNHISSNLQKTLQSLFPIDSDFDATEAYAETWARIINCAFCSFNSLGNKKEYTLFKDYMNFCIEFERIFSLYQCNKILNFMGLSYEDLHGDKERHAYLRKNLYRENTHVFAYYVLTSIFLNNYSGFLEWCYTHNPSLLQFNNTEPTINAFAEYIENNYNTPLFNASINNMNQLYNTFGNTLDKNKNKYKYKKLLTSSRMSMIEFL